MYWIAKILKGDKIHFNLSPSIERGRIPHMMISPSIISASGILLTSELWTKFVPLV